MSCKIAWVCGSITVRPSCRATSSSLIFLGLEGHAFAALAFATLGFTALATATLATTTLATTTFATATHAPATHFHALLSLNDIRTRLLPESRRPPSLLLPSGPQRIPSTSTAAANTLA